MDNYEDDDDTHYCIKCHLTLSGLENYIRHRQTDCRTIDPKNDITTESSIATELSELSANFFFNSLQLQMCTKTKTTCDNRISNELDKKLINKNDDKRGNKKQQQKNDDMTSDTLQSVDLEDLSDHIGIPSLVGFPDIVNFNDTNKTTLTTTTTTTTSSTASSKFVSSASLKTNDKKRNDDHRSWLDDTFEDIDVNKEPIKVHFNSYDTDEDDDTDDETSDDDDDDDDDQDSYPDSDEQDEEEYPQQRHTGGKWKPGQLLHHITTTNHDDDTEDYRPESPPSHTGGKWKPSEKIEEDDHQHDQDDDAEDEDRENEKNVTEQEQQHELENDNYDDDDEEDDNDDEYKNTMISKNQLPPLGHTRGKWIPGSSIGPTETITDHAYWCSPCGRKLATKLLYNRHLLSDLHKRRSIHEIEGDINLPKSVDTLSQSKRHSKRQQLLKNRNEAENRVNIIDNKQTNKKKRRREKILLHCEMCNARVRRLQLGKHLLSHYHCRIAGLNPCSPKAQNFILENMKYVVRQCPFQCSSCRFYCNTEETFLLHWRSKLHCNSQDDHGYHYLCACCNFWCETNELMEKHMISVEHRDAVIMINGSVPIVIGKQRILSCDTCYRRFRYNFQLRMHSKDTGHLVSTTASDDYQQIITCNVCCQIFRSQVRLQRHQLSSHTVNNPTDDKTKPYFCSFCSINFKTTRAAVMHRRTPAHKQVVKEHKLTTKDLLQKTCMHCNIILENLKTYKRHLLQYHRDFCHSCPKCGMVFALHQEVTKHTKNFECRDNLKQSEHVDDDDKKWKCKNCPFSVNSHSEYLFHQALHCGMIQSTTQQPSSSKTTGKYCCPVCDKLLPKESLRNHIRIHTGEKPFTCRRCYQSFVMRSTFNVHNKICQGINLTNKKDSKERQRNYICSECNAAFLTKHNLRQHMLRHNGKNYKCKYPDCPTYLRTENELKTHLTIVHETDTANKKYQCDKCSYAGKTKAQLRRHEVKHEESTDEGQLRCQYEHCMFVSTTVSHLQRHIRIHTGKKPYKCRHCTYASNNLENLRKHVLSTKIHPGKMIYECDTCHKNNIKNVFCTNYTKILRSHLVESHPQEFPTPDHASRYASSLFDDKN